MAHDIDAEYKEIKEAFLAGEVARDSYLSQNYARMGFRKVVGFATRMAREKEMDLYGGSATILLTANHEIADEQKRKLLQKAFADILHALPCNQDLVGFQLAFLALRDAEDETGVLPFAECETAFRGECAKLNELCIDESRRMNEIIKQAKDIYAVEEQVTKMRKISGYPFGVVPFFCWVITTYATKISSMSARMAILTDSYVKTSDGLAEIGRRDNAILIDTAVASSLPRVLKISQAATANYPRRMNEAMDNLRDLDEASLQVTVRFLQTILERTSEINPDFVKARQSAMEELRPFLNPTVPQLIGFDDFPELARR